MFRTGSAIIGNQLWVVRWDTRTNGISALRNDKLKYRGGVRQGKLFLDGCIFGCIIDKLSESLGLKEQRRTRK